MAREHRTSEFQPDWGLPWRPVLTREQVEMRYAGPGPWGDPWKDENLARYLRIRKECEKGAIDNPVGQGWSLPMWDKVQKNFNKYRTHCILGGNRSGKSVFASRMAVWCAATIPESQVRMYHVNSERSIEQQQMVYDALPIGVKDVHCPKCGWRGERLC